MHHRHLGLARVIRNLVQRRNESWAGLCATLDDPRNQSRCWRILDTMLRPKVPRCPALSIAVARQITSAQVAELIADNISVLPHAPPSTHAVSLAPPEQNWCELFAPFRFFSTQGIRDQIHTLCNEDFTLYELTFVLQSRKRRSAPGSDGITYQMLPNLDHSQLPHLVEAYNAVSRSGVIPASWKGATNVPLLKKVKPASHLTSYRPISLTSATGKVLEAMALRRLDWIAAALDFLPP
ncbi:hypothetical protein HPB49_015519 [Dermacentor silvarum]|uniref:Uncharacterized protein n=1 Tax=Dermacentor silvarum TaxID=543639 RepID=A0ACB8DQ09_DERSI|nr:hypothetical protein HPB49_015519 [Dermacentor silvarum]